jgi:hypothetical protein
MFPFCPPVSFVKILFVSRSALSRIRKKKKKKKNVSDKYTQKERDHMGVKKVDYSHEFTYDGDLRITTEHSVSESFGR